MWEEAEVPARTTDSPAAPRQNHPMVSGFGKPPRHVAPGGAKCPSQSKSPGNSGLLPCSEPMSVTTKKRGPAGPERHGNHPAQGRPRHLARGAEPPGGHLSRNVPGTCAGYSCHPEQKCLVSSDGSWARYPEPRRVYRASHAAANVRFVFPRRRENRQVLSNVVVGRCAGSRVPFPAPPRVRPCLASASIRSGATPSGSG